MDIGDFRREYLQSGLQRTDLSDNPFMQFDTWFQQACAVDLPDPSAMMISTVSKKGQPSLRTVLLKSYDEKGFVFFTNYSSRKAQDISENTQVALLFPWLALERQVEILGVAEKISTSESLRYFNSRPRSSQVGAWVSRQSSVIRSRQVLEKKHQEMKTKFGHDNIPLPEFWGGYRVIPQSIEFWQGRAGRLHDRFEYTQNHDHWNIQRLAP